MKHFYLLFLLTSTFAFPQIPAGYYNSATGTGYTLKTQLEAIINNSNDGLSPEFLSVDPGYGALYTTYETSDIDLYYENNGSMLDMYSENPTGMDNHEFFYNSVPSQQDPGSGGTSEGQFYNREHIIPQSTFDEATPMRSDAHFVVPADKYINGQRGSFPFGDVATPSPMPYSNGSQRGSSDVIGYSGTVFEPIDEFKGDIARMHFYFATRYESTVAGYDYDMFNNTNDQVFETAFLNVLLAWHNSDPVSQREIDRNNAIFAIQNNRNPFIDNPQYVTEIWSSTADTEVPTVPTNLTASNPTSSTVDLAWTASTDNVAVTTYDVYVNGSFYVTTNSNLTTYTVTGLTPETAYTFTILAKDAASNASALSTSTSETTTAGPPAGSDCVAEDFENIPSNSGSYSTRTWTGVDGINDGWTATDSRTDQTLNSRSICVRNGTLSSPSIVGGIGSITLTAQATFSSDTAGNFDVLVNGSSVGTIPYNDNSGSPTTTTINNINIEGTISLVLDNQSTSNRVRIDDLSWTCYSTLGNNDFTLNDIKIFPNPAKGNEVEIIYNRDIFVEVYDVLGKRVKQQNLTSNQKRLNISGLRKGIYLLKIKSDNEIITKKLIRQ